MVKYCVSEFLGNHESLIHQNNVTINKKAMSDFPILLNVRWGELSCFRKSWLDSFNEMLIFWVSFTCII